MAEWREEQPAGNVNKNWTNGDISGYKMIAGVYGGRLYSFNGTSWSEQQPTGNVNKNWVRVGISGSNMIAGVDGGRLYSFNGTSWSEQQPAGDYNKIWYGAGISGNKMIAAVYNGRLYSFNGASWSEQQPAGAVDKAWLSAGISGDSMIAGVYGGRLYSFNGASWSEQQPAGAVDKDWRSAGISGNNMIAAVHNGRLYSFNGTSWSEQQPAGAVDKAWFVTGISGNEMIAGVSPGRLYYYNGTSWSEQTPAGDVNEDWYIARISGDKMIAGISDGRLYSFNILMVTTQIPTDVLQTTVTANGTMVASGGENATIEGFEYGLTQTGTWDQHTHGSFAVGTFTEAITGLTVNTSYWIRAYATNSIGTSYGAWVQFQTAAVGIIPTGTKIDLCADYLGYTYQLQKSETDDGLPYSAYFVINTDLTSDKTGLTYYKRILDLDLYFRCETLGTAEIYVKRDSEATWQYLGSVGLTDITAPAIIIKHLAIDTKAKDFDFKISYGNACRFLGLIFQFLPGGER